VQIKQFKDINENDNDDDKSDDDYDDDDNDDEKMTMLAMIKMKDKWCVCANQVRFCAFCFNLIVICF